MSKLIRISQEAFDKLHLLAKKKGISKQKLIDRALERIAREALMEQADRAYESLQKDKKELEERQMWDATLADGIEDE